MPQENKLTLSLLACEEGEVPPFVFEVKAGAVSCKITLYDQSLMDAGKWVRLLEAAESGSDAFINYCDSNGNVSVATDDGYTHFQVSKHGSGGDGCITVHLENECCLDALREAVACFKK